MALALTACPSKKPDSPTTETPAAEVKTPLDASFVDLDKVFFVTSNGKSENDGSSWAKAKDLKSAIVAAHAHTTKKTLLVAEGTYFTDPLKSNPNISFELKDGVKIYGGFVATVPLKRHTNASILDGLLQKAEGTKKAVHTVTIVKGENLSNKTILDGFLIQNAKGDYAQGLFLKKSSPQLSNLTFTNNQKNGGFAFGAAIYNSDNSNPNISNSSFSNNVSMSGAIYNGNSSPSISNSLFSNNTGTTGSGAIYNETNSHAKISNCTFINNFTKHGGAGAIDNDKSNPKIYNSIFWNNKANDKIANINNKSGSKPVIKYSILNANSIIGENTAIDISTGTDKGNNQTPAAFSIDAKGKVASANQDLIKDKGDHALYEEVTGVYPGDPEKDLAGKPRVQGSKIDLGAYEIHE